MPFEAWTVLNATTEAPYYHFNMEPGMNPSSNASKNTLSSDVEIKGSLKFSGELAFDGKLEGEIQTDGTLHLGDSAVVNGNISAQAVIVRGKINGNISAKEKIDIKSKTELFGDIRASKLVIEEGVTFVGKTEVNPNKVAPSTAPPPRSVEPARANDSAKPVLR
jgi:cytoskeletal protein CcmA (bactofilin family)